MKVLIVDDDDSIREMLSEMLSLKGVDISMASSGKEAIEILQNQKFDFIVMDINMPGMDGIATTIKIKDKNLQGDAKIIAFTGECLTKDLSRQIFEVAEIDFCCINKDYREIIALLFPQKESVSVA